MSGEQLGLYQYVYIQHEWRAVRAVPVMTTRWKLLLFQSNYYDNEKEVKKEPKKAARSVITIPGVSITGVMLPESVCCVP